MPDDGYRDEWGVWHSSNPPDMGNAAPHPSDALEAFRAAMLRKAQAEVLATERPARHDAPRAAQTGQDDRTPVLASNEASADDRAAEGHPAVDEQAARWIPQKPEPVDNATGLRLLLRHLRNRG